MILSRCTFRAARPLSSLLLQQSRVVGSHGVAVCAHPRATPARSPFSPSSSRAISTKSSQYDEERIIGTGINPPSLWERFYQFFVCLKPLAPSPCPPRMLECCLCLAAGCWSSHFSCCFSYCSARHSIPLLPAILPLVMFIEPLAALPARARAVRSPANMSPANPARSRARGAQRGEVEENGEDETVGFRNASCLKLLVRVLSGVQQWVVERFGKYKDTLMPGLNFIVPLLDRVAYKHVLKVRMVEMNGQLGISKDNVELAIDGE